MLESTPTLVRRCCLASVRVHPLQEKSGAAVLITAATAMIEGELAGLPTETVGSFPEFPAAAMISDPALSAALPAFSYATVGGADHDWSVKRHGNHPCSILNGQLIPARMLSAPGRSTKLFRKDDAGVRIRSGAPHPPACGLPRMCQCSACRDRGDPARVDRRMWR